MGESLSCPLIVEPHMKVLSYATRGMETLRGFEFYRAAVKALQTIPNLIVIIAGRDKQAYSYPAPSHEGSWKSKLIEEAGNFDGKDRIYFTGLMPYIYYKKLIQRSNLHCYFTRPYVTSWSLFEAASCGARLCVSESPATENIIADEKTVQWIDLDKEQQIQEIIMHSLKNCENIKRSNLRSEFFLTLSRQWVQLLNKYLR